MKRPARCTLGAALAAALYATDARALTSCSITSVSGISFGAYDVFQSSPLDSTGSVTVFCAAVLPTDSLVLDLGRGSSSTFSRTLRKAGSTLAYNLYLNAGRTTVWGDGTGGTSHYVFTPAVATYVAVPIYARIPARQNVTSGSYTDTITVTLNF